MAKKTNPTQESETSEVDETFNQRIEAAKAHYQLAEVDVWQTFDTDQIRHPNKTDSTVCIITTDTRKLYYPPISE